MTKPTGDTRNAAGLPDADKPDTRVVPLVARRASQPKLVLLRSGGGNDDDAGPSAA